MLGIDPKELPEMQEKYALELFQAIKKRKQEKSINSDSSDHAHQLNASWIF